MLVLKVLQDSLATYYMLYDDINLINKEIDIYRSITRARYSRRS